MVKPTPTDVYYTVKSVKSEVDDKGLHVMQPIENAVPLSNWNRCGSCRIKCINKQCTGLVDIDVHNRGKGTAEMIQLEIHFFLNKKEKAFIKANSIPMRKLLGIINENMLKKVNF